MQSRPSSSGITVHLSSVDIRSGSIEMLHVLFPNGKAPSRSLLRLLAGKVTLDFPEDFRPSPQFAPAADPVFRSFAKKVFESFPGMSIFLDWTTASIFEDLFLATFDNLAVTQTDTRTRYGFNHVTFERLLWRELDAARDLANRGGLGKKTDALLAGIEKCLRKESL